MGPRSFKNTHTHKRANQTSLTGYTGSYIDIFFFGKLILRSILKPVPPLARIQAVPA